MDLEAHIGGYEAATKKGERIQECYSEVADLVGARPGNIAFVENATAAFIQALSSIPFERGDILLTTRNDYNSNQIQYLSLAKRLGLKVVRAPDLPEGGVDPDAMRDLIGRHRPKLVSVTWVPTNSGLVQPVAEIGRICREREVLYLVDACQAVGQMPIDVAEIGCDFLSATSRKFLRGPRGCGFLFASDRVLESKLEPLFIDIRGAEWLEADRYRPDPTARRFENWEFAWSLVLGIGEAARYCRRLGLEAISERVRKLADLARNQAAAVRGARILDRGSDLCGIVTVHIEGKEPAPIREELGRRGINIGLASRGGAVIDFDDKGVDWALRISPHYYNTEDEVKLTIAAVAECAS
jgi:selenocysteine lyase/cysteine desulfurase